MEDISIINDNKKPYSKGTLTEKIYLLLEKVPDLLGKESISIKEFTVLFIKQYKINMSLYEYIRVNTYYYFNRLIKKGILEKNKEQKELTEYKILDNFKPKEVTKDSKSNKNRILHILNKAQQPLFVYEIANLAEKEFSLNLLELKKFKRGMNTYLKKMLKNGEILANKPIGQPYKTYCLQLYRTEELNNKNLDKKSKICLKCKQSKTIDNYIIVIRNNKLKESPRCNSCLNEKKNKSEKIKFEDITKKVCKKCEKEKDVKYFYVHINKRVSTLGKGILVNKSYYSNCMDCTYEISLNWRKEHEKEYLDYQKQYHKNYIRKKPGIKKVKHEIN